MGVSWNCSQTRDASTAIRLVINRHEWTFSFFFGKYAAGHPCSSLTTTLMHAFTSLTATLCMHSQLEIILILSHQVFIFYINPLLSLDRDFSESQFALFFSFLWTGISSPCSVEDGSERSNPFDHLHKGALILSLYIQRSQICCF